MLPQRLETIDERQAQGAAREQAEREYSFGGYDREVDRGEALGNDWAKAGGTPAELREARGILALPLLAVANATACFGAIAGHFLDWR